MWRVMVAGIVVMVVGCSARTQVDPPAPLSADETCTPIGASPSTTEDLLYLIDGRAGSRVDLTGTCEESIDRVEVLKGSAAAKYVLMGDTSNGVVLIHTKTGHSPESR